MGFNNHQWTMSSWFCCPSGSQHQSSVVVPNIPLNSFIQGTMYQPGPDMWQIVSEVHLHHVVLTAKTPRVFNWLDATLETYDITSCKDFPSGAFEFYNIEATNSAAKQLPISWLNDHPEGTMCGGKMTIYNAKEIGITHDPNGNL